MSSSCDDTRTRYDAPRYRTYVLAMLTLGYLFSSLDRFLVAILQEPIKNELKLTDTQLGLLTGFAFVIFYAGFGVVIARWADRGVRRSIVAWSIAVWSLMTAATGMARDFAQIFLARCGVGIGEGGASPASLSMLTDMYPPQQRASAIGIYMSGVPLGTLFGLALGGWLNEQIGWRNTFLVMGAAGLLLAPLFRFSIAEPRRTGGPAAAVEPAPPLAEVAATLYHHPVFRHLALGPAFSAFATTAMVNWLPSYLIRAHGMGTAEIGLRLALASGVLAGIGTVAGGYLSDWTARRDPRRRLLIPTLGVFLAAPFIFATLMVDDGRTALALYLVPGLLMSLWLGPVHSINQGLVPNRMRATAAGIIVLVMNMIGVGLAPLVVGMLSDHLMPQHGVNGLRMAIMIVAGIGCALAALHFLLAMRAMARMPPDAANTAR
ncbi:MAG: spinster family MFS transporter [Gammaproteobacteria bacterium]